MMFVNIFEKEGEAEFRKRLTLMTYPAFLRAVVFNFLVELSKNLD